MKKTLVAAVLALAVGPAAWAVDTCNGLLAIDFVNPPAVVHVGDTLTVMVTLGTGSIAGGSSLTITKVFYDRDCAPPLAPDCTPLNQGAIQFADNASTNCPVVLTPVVDSPNRNAFTASLTIPANKGIPPGFCSFQFDITVTEAGTFDGVVSFGTSLTPGAMCNNGLLVSGGFQTLALTVLPQVADYSCFQVTGGGLKPKIPVTVVDQFGTYTPTLTDLHRICLPADKNGEDPSAPTKPNHLASYFPVSTTNPTLAKGVSATTQFGTFTMDVLGFNRLLVPTAKKLTPPPPDPLPANAIHHFACHNITNLKGPNLSKKAVTVVDQFASTPIPGFVSTSKWKLCLAADKNGEDPGAPASGDALMCYFAGRTPPFATKKLFLNNQFGPNQFANQPTATQYDELCEPAVVTP
jgi:hypothetical protein